MLLLYADKLTNRLRYITKLLLSDLAGLEVQYTTNAEDFLAYQGPRINYSPQPFESGQGLYFCSTNLLFETGLEEQQPQPFEHEGQKGLFPVSQETSALPFDPFAAAFYLVSRYEEYLPHLKDKFGRFNPRESIAFKNGFLQKAVVNRWANIIVELLREKYPSIKIKKPEYRFISTIDIDSAWAYKHKGLVRTISGFLRAMLMFNFKEVSERTKVLLGREKDPFDSYALQQEIQLKYRVPVIYFILFADYDQYDKNIPITDPKFHELIKSLGDFAWVGIHPSFASNDDLEKLKKEIKGLSYVLKREITLSRQHYLKLTLPDAYRNLQELDIFDDYTMGYASQPGFRAGICSTFNFFDLDRNAETPLRVHPFAFMEGTLRDYMNVPAENAIKHIIPLIDEVKSVGGTFISLWHNDSLAEKGRWKGWSSVYEEMVNIARKK